jgi:rRNA maturation RNase YbeY
VKNVEFVFCSNAEILRLNKKFLGHEYHTDILTFDLQSADGIESEVYISLPTVRKNSTLYNTPFQNELYRVIIHSVLHLCGYRDDKIALKKIMHDKQEDYLIKYLDLLKNRQP